jgi:peptide/nickel transport system substrate-binding protein
MDRRKFLTTTGLLGGGVALAGCGGSDTTDPTETPTEAGTEPSDDDQETDSDASDKRGGSFINTTSEDATTLDPRMNELAWVNGMNHYLYDGLMMITPDGSDIVPHLAAEEPTAEDDTTFVFDLREGVSFHNGDELTPEDVAYSFNWVLEPDNASPNRANLQFIDDVEATGDYEVTFNLAHPFALFEQTLAGMNAAIVPKSVTEDVGPDEFGQNPVGTGPFAFKEWSSASHITLERHDDYFLEAPNIDELTYRVIPKPEVQFVDLATGEVHQASVPKDLIGKAENESGVQMKRIAHFDYNGVIFNSLREPFDDVRVREAMNYLVDYDDILQATKGDLGKRTYGFMPLEVNEAWDFPYEEWKEKYYPEKDHDKAQQLLEEAGYGDGFEVQMSSLTFGKFKNMMIILQNEMNEVGIDAEIQEVTIGEWLDQLDTGNYDATIYGWSGGQDPDGFFYYLFRNLRNDEGGAGEDFVGNASAGMLHEAYPDDDELAEADERIRQARQLQDREERKAHYEFTAEVFQSRYPHIPVYSEQDATAWSTSVKDYEPTAFAAQPLHNHWSNAWLDE